MSLTVDGIWKAGVWATTVWADGVWREGAPTPPAPSVGTATGGGGAFMLTDAGAKRKKKDRQVRLDLEEAFAIFNEAPPAVVAEVRQIVAPAVVQERRAGPVVVDFTELVQGVERVKRLLALAAEEESRRRFEEEDESDVEFILRYG